MSKVHALPFAQIPEWVLDADISDRATRLFSVLHRYANSDGRAFPGRRVIAARMRCSVDSVDRAMNELADISALVVEPHFRADRSQTANSYWLWPLTPSAVAQVAPHTDGPPTAKPRPPVSADAAPYRKESQGNERQWNEITPSPASDDAGKMQIFDPTTLPPKPPPSGPTFEDFYKAYPRKKEPDAARKAWDKRIKEGVDGREILRGTKRHAANTAQTAKNLIKYPASWLNAGGWKDGQEESASDLAVRAAVEAGKRAREMAQANGKGSQP